jgi:ABC-type phosphate transport system substrate-binding protein
MRSIRKKLVATAVVAVSVLSTASVAKAEDVTGGGASFPYTFLVSAIAEFNKTTGHNLTYTSTGSGTGKRNFKSGTFKFAGTDSAVGSSDIPSFGWTYVPYLAGATAVAYRLDEIKGATLSLSKDTLNGIFSGVITKWNDPNIAADQKISPAYANQKKKSDLKGASTLWENVASKQSRVTVTLLPATEKSAKGKTIEVIDTKTKKVVRSATVAAKGQYGLTFASDVKNEYQVKVAGKEVAKYKVAPVTLPDRPIVVVYRQDPSGTTNNFCLFMKEAVNPGWTQNDNYGSCVPGGISRFGSRFQGQNTSTNLSNYIADTNGTIGYTEVSYVTDPSRAAKGIRAANIRNAAGAYVAPTSFNYNSFLRGASLDAQGLATFNYKQTSNKTAYPIGPVTYGLGQTSNDAKNKVVAQFFEWVLTKYAPANAEALGYTPLLGSFQSKGVALAKKIGAS